MSRFAGTATRPGGGEAWSRQRLLGVLAAVVVTALLLVFGLVQAIYLTVVGDLAAAEPAAEANGQVEDAQTRRNRIAAAPMLEVTPGDAQPAVPAATSAPVLVVPPATTAGPAGVPSGFPRTPEGAVAQLAAIESSVFQAMSIPLTVQIHEQWTLPATGTDRPDTPAGEGDAAGVAGWEITQHVQSFLGTAQMGLEKDLTTTVTVTPAAAQVKGVDGRDWVLACVLLEVRAVIVTEARLGFGHCERMQWQDGRWLIGPGEPPARAPSTWPGSQLSLDAGWRTWVEADSETTGSTTTGSTTTGNTTTGNTTATTTGDTTRDSSGAATSPGPDGPWRQDTTEGDGSDA